MALNCGIVGLPNVGKSTLMKKMTGSDVEIQNYPFTTKGLMFSYLKYNDKKITEFCKLLTEYDTINLRKFNELKKIFYRITLKEYKEYNFRFENKLLKLPGCHSEKYGVDKIETLENDHGIISTFSKGLLNFNRYL